MEFWVNVLNQAIIVAIFAVSLSVILGVAGQLSVAPAGLGGVGGYMAGYLSAAHGFAFLPALAVGVAAATICGLLVAIPALRLSQEYLILLTLAFATVVVAVIEAIPALGGANGLLGIHTVSLGGPLLTPTKLFWLVLIVAVVCVSVCWRMTSSPFGRVLRGIREDSDATQAVGKNVIGYKITAFAWTSAVAGVAGVMLVYYDQIASPTSFNFSATTAVVAAVVIGGMGSLGGAVVGAMILTFIGPVLQKLVSVNPDSASLWQLVIYGVLLVAVMRLRPAGLIPEGSAGRSFNKLMMRLKAPPAAVATPAVAAEAVPAMVSSSVGNGNGGGRSIEMAHAVSAHLVAADVHVPTQSHTVAAEAQSVPGEVVLRATGLVKHFGGIRAVQGLDLELRAGVITALVGPNGAGKTTVFNLLTGRIRPDAGDVVLRGRDITGMAPHRVAALGMVRSFQDVRTLTRISVLENVCLSVPDQPGEHMGNLFLRPGVARRGQRRTKRVARECLAFVGLEDRADEIAGGMGYGDQKLLAIARLLATGSDVLLLDEPAAGIDRANLEPVLETIERLRGEGKTICLVEHNLDVVKRLSDHVFFMEEGRVTAQGTMDTITNSERLAEVYFGHV